MQLLRILIITSTAAPENKGEEWKRLVEEHKLGYLALIRNLRNIIETNTDTSWLEEYVCPQLENEYAIKKSLVFPYQIYQAYRSIPKVFCIENSLEKAFRLACNNVPTFSGVTAIFLDVSGSMLTPISNKSNITICEVGAVFAATLYLNNNIDNIHLIKFGATAKVCHYPLINTNVFAAIDQMCKNEGCGYMTCLNAAFDKINYPINRLFIISDMQTMDRTGYSGFESCCNKTDSNCKCYSFDLGNYHWGARISDYPNVHCLTSLNEKIFDFVNLLESGNNSIMEYINTNYNYC